MRFHLRPSLFEISHQVLFFGSRLRQIFELRRWAYSLFRRLPENVAHALASRSNGLEFSHMLNALDGLGTGQRVHYILRVGCERRLNYVIRVPAYVFQIELQSLAKKSRHRIRELRIVHEFLFHLRSLIPGPGVAHEIRKAQRELLLSDDLHDSIGLPAERKRIL